MAFEVTPAQRAALEAACETLIPALQAPEGGDKAYWAATPADFNVPQQILDLMEAHIKSKPATTTEIFVLGTIITQQCIY